jgi:hypothetical protein
MSSCVLDVYGTPCTTTFAPVGVVRSVTFIEISWYGVVNAVPVPEVLYRSGPHTAFEHISYLNANERATCEPVEGE